MTVITRDELLAAKPLSREVKLTEEPFEGRTIKVRLFSRGARKLFLAALADKDQDAVEMAVVDCLEDPALEKSDIDALNALNFRVVDEIVQAIVDMNAAKPAKSTQDIEDLMLAVRDGKVEVAEAVAIFQADAQG